jgi:hypothetical protein
VRCSVLTQFCTDQHWAHRETNASLTAVRLSFIAAYSMMRRSMSNGKVNAEICSDIVMVRSQELQAETDHFAIAQPQVHSLFSYAMDSI